MAAPRKYPDELRERAIRAILDLLEDDLGSQRGVFRRVGDQLGVTSETLRGWVRQTRVDAGARPGTTTDDAQKIVELETEVRELRRANAMADSSSSGIKPGSVQTLRPAIDLARDESTMTRPRVS